MNEDSIVVRFSQPDTIDDPLTAVLRSGARRLLAQAIEAEAEAFLAAMAERRLGDGRARFVRHGHGPERTIQTGIGPVEVQRVKVRDRAPAESDERVRFTSQILPRWARRTRSLEALLGLCASLVYAVQAATCSSAACTGSPSRKRTPWITWASRCEPSSRRQLRSADWASL